MLKIFLFVLGGILGAIGALYFTQDKSNDDVFKKIHVYLYDAVFKQVLTQTEMNEYASIAVNVINLRRQLLEKEDDTAWKEMYTEKLKDPSDFEGGSLSSLDILFRAYELQLDRINNILISSPKHL